MSDGEGFARRVSLENLEDFAPLLGSRRQDRARNGAEVEEPSDPDGANRANALDPDVAAAEELFQGTSVKVTIGHRRASTPGRSRRSLANEDEVAGDLGQGPLLWQRSGLPASSVQRQEGHVTGGARLVQAGFEGPDGEVIDHTTYFRREAFGELDWEVGSEEPFREDAYAEFDVNLLGTDYGRHRMRISHKPSGEADQGNYTTMLHWGDLGDTVRELNLVGRTLSLYHPPAGSNGPYYLKVS